MNEERRPILVTGASGNVGSEVVKSLYELGWLVRATAFDDADVARVPTEADEIVRFDFGNPDSYPAALAGVKRLFLMRPPAISDIDTYIRPFIEYAAEVGIEQIAFLSLMGAEKNHFVPHHKVEQLLEQSGVPYTFLRAGFFMQNLDTTHRLDIMEYDEIFIPAGHGKTAFVDVRDLGAVAAKVLTEAGHENKAYALTGPEALDYDEVAEIFSEVLGREIVYSNPSLLRFARRMKARGHAWRYVLVMSGIYLTTRFGAANHVTDDVAQLLGRPPRTVREYVEDYADVWAYKSVQAGKKEETLEKEKVLA